MYLHISIDICYSPQTYHVCVLLVLSCICIVRWPCVFTKQQLLGRHNLLTLYQYHPTTSAKGLQVSLVTKAAWPIVVV